MEVAGVDGCPGGWLVVWADADRLLRLLTIRVVPTFAEVLERTQHCASIGIDIPIGLSEDDRRAPDIEARKVLRPLRHNSVFPAPIRAVLGVPDYKEACAISAKVHRDGKKISKQTHALSVKIHEVDRLMSPDLQARIVEVHPEVCFWALDNGRPMPNPKRSPAGEFERLQLLSNVFVDDLSAADLPAQAAKDDFFDACAAAWTASRLSCGEAQRLPADPPLDSRGLRMEIVYRTLPSPWLPPPFSLGDRGRGAGVGSRLLPSPRLARHGVRADVAPSPWLPPPLSLGDRGRGVRGEGATTASHEADMASRPYSGAYAIRLSVRHPLTVATVSGIGAPGRPS